MDEILVHRVAETVHHDHGDQQRLKKSKYLSNRPARLVVTVLPRLDPI